ncbi:hypothetical protein ABBQ38_009162 [Trebouxia sp. C0009 RCD-2024]
MDSKQQKALLQSVRSSLLTEAPDCVPNHLRFRALDVGGNPDISTLDLFKQGLQENQATKGKVQALQQLREDLDKELQQAYPAAFTAYSAVKATPASPAPTDFGDPPKQ